MPEDTPPTGEQTEQPATEPRQTFHRTFVRGLLDLITLRNENVVKTDSFDEATVQTGGELTCEITRIEQANPGLPDYFLHVSILGRTFASEDGTKEVIRGMFDDVLAAYSTFTSVTLASCVPAGAKVLGVLPVTNAAIREGAEEFVFTVDFKIVVSELNFQQQEE